MIEKNLLDIKNKERIFSKSSIITFYNDDTN
jgi:hypothetical protein